MAYTDYSAVQARNATDLAIAVNAAIADGWQPLAAPTLAANGTLVQPLVKGTPSGGGSGEVTAADITDATAVGRDVLTAANAAAARAAIGAGTSSLALGTTASTAMAGNYAPPNAATGTHGLVLMGTAVANATDGTDVVAQLNALLASLRTAGSLDT